MPLTIVLAIDNDIIEVRIHRRQRQRRNQHRLALVPQGTFGEGQIETGHGQGQRRLTPGIKTVRDPHRPRYRPATQCHIPTGICRQYRQAGIRHINAKQIQTIHLQTDLAQRRLAGTAATPRLAFNEGISRSPIKSIQGSTLA